MEMLAILIPSIDNQFATMLLDKPRRISTPAQSTVLSVMRLCHHWPNATMDELCGDPNRSQRRSNFLYHQRAKPQAEDVWSSDTLATMFAPLRRRLELCFSFTYDFLHCIAVVLTDPRGPVTRYRVGFLIYSKHASSALTMPPREARIRFPSAARHHAFAQILA